MVRSEADGRHGGAAEFAHPDAEVGAIDSHAAAGVPGHVAGRESTNAALPVERVPVIDVAVIVEIGILRRRVIHRRGEILESRIVIAAEIKLRWFRGPAIGGEHRAIELNNQTSVARHLSPEGYTETNLHAKRHA
jgi:hypothetical protein